MLSIRNLAVSFGEEKVLKKVNLEVAAGEKLAIVGESGAGKTTLAMTVMGLVKGRVTGEVIFEGENLLSCPEPVMEGIRGKKIAMVFQNVESALHPLYRICDQVAESIKLHGGLGRTGAVRLAKELLLSLGFDRQQVFSYPHQLSGGEKQKALLAVALANDPPFIILDEPTASLDAVAKRELISFLQKHLRRKTVLLITHDLDVAGTLAEKTAVLYGGRIVEYGPADEVLRDPRHPYTRGLIRSYPGMERTKDLQGIPGNLSHDVDGCPFNPRCTQKIECCAYAEPPVVLTHGRLVACHRGGIVPVLAVQGLSKSYGKKTVLENINLVLYAGETYALVGRSGSGKSTLARLLLGLDRPDGGSITLDGQHVPGSRTYTSSVRAVFQNPHASLSHRLNVMEIVREPLDIAGCYRPEERKELVLWALEQVELHTCERFLHKYPHQLSGGEAQRVAIARALVTKPRLLVADEPTSALDCSVQAKIMRLLLDLQEKMGLTILFITHDIGLAKKVSDRLGLLWGGEIIEEGPTWEVIQNPRRLITAEIVGAAKNYHATGSETGSKAKEQEPFAACGYS